MRTFLYASYKKTGFRCYTTNSRARHQAGTCFMLSLEIWQGKPFSQVRIQDQRKTPPWLLQQEGGQLQSSVALGLSSLEPWLPALGARPAPKCGALRWNINFLELRTLLPQTAGNTERKSSPGTGNSRFHKPSSATPAIRNAEFICLSQGETRGLHRYLSSRLLSPFPKEGARMSCKV